MAKTPPLDHSVCRNRKATHRFEILDQMECGIVLRGTEVKSVRERAVSLDEAYARIEDNEVWLLGCHIAPYSHGQGQNHDPLRRRKLLLHVQQIRKLRPQVEQKGLTLVPLKLYFSERGIAKVTLAIARGRRAADKRQAMKAREHAREIARASSRRR